MQTAYAKNHDIVRSTFELALKKVGFDVALGFSIWEAYIQWEKSHEGNVSSPKVTLAVRSLYHRQLSLPSSVLLATMKEYTGWEIDESQLNKIKPAFQKAKLRLDNISEFERNVKQDAVAQRQTDLLNKKKNLSVKDLHDEKLAKQQSLIHDWSSYMSYEINNNDHETIVSVCERAITACSLAQQIWTTYITYWEKVIWNHSKHEEIEIDIETTELLEILKRAYRNVPWSSNIICSLLCEMERKHLPHTEIKGF